MAGGDQDGDEYYFALARGAFYQIVLRPPDEEAAPEEVLRATRAPTTNSGRGPRPMLR